MVIDESTTLTVEQFSGKHPNNEPWSFYAIKVNNEWWFAGITDSYVYKWMRLSSDYEFSARFGSERKAADYISHIESILRRTTFYNDDDTQKSTDNRIVLLMGRNNNQS